MLNLDTHEEGRDLKKKATKTLAALLLLTPITVSSTALAAGANVSQIEGFIKSLIDSVAGLSGLIAAGFFVLGGYRYITSSGNPQHLDKAKRTILFSATGLAITIGAFVLSNIIGGLASSAFGG